MKRTSLLLITALVGLSMLVSCRPAELEGAFVEYKAKAKTWSFRIRNG